MKPLISAMCAVSLAACSSASIGSGEHGTLEDRLWVFEANSLVDAWVEAVGSEPLTLEFENGRMNGFAGCNAFFGEYAIDGSSIELGPIGSSRKLCYGEIQQQEDVILEALERVTSYELEGDYLRLMTGGDTALVYRKMPGETSIIDHGGLHTFETCRDAGGTVNDQKTECRIDGRVLQAGVD